MMKWPKDLKGVNVHGIIPIARVEDIIRPSGNKEAWLCECPYCSNEFIAARNDIVTGHTKSCGCLNYNRQREDLSGQRYGFLFIEKLDHIHITPSGQKIPYWLCLCDCGNKAVVSQNALKNGYVLSCGCFRKKKLSKIKALDLTNRRFGMLLVLERIEGRTNHRNAIWKCLCDCGKICEVPSPYLLSYHTLSCGCKGRSSGETAISLILDKINAPYETWFAFDDLKGNKNMPLRFDFALFDYNHMLLGLIEYQGEQHYKENKGTFGAVQRLRTDPQKREYCRNHNIILEEIRYDENIINALQKALKTIYSHANFVLSPKGKV